MVNSIENLNQNYSFPDQEIDKLEIERLDFEKFQRLIKKTKWYLIEDALQSPEKRRMLAQIFNVKVPSNTIEKDLVAKIADNEKYVDRLLGEEIDDKIEEAYDQIFQSFDKGELPIVTIDPAKFQNCLNGIRTTNRENTYDKQNKIVGTLGIKPFKAEERIVCQINLAPSEVIPRLTGRNAAYNGVVVLPSNIPPKNIMILSSPAGTFLDEIKLPKLMSEIKQKIN